MLKGYIEIACNRTRYVFILSGLPHAALCNIFVLPQVKTCIADFLESVKVQS